MSKNVKVKVKSSKGVALAEQQLQYYETIKAKKEECCFFSIGWFWLPIQLYNRRSIDKSSPPVITFVLAFMCKAKEEIPTEKTIG